MKFTEEQKEEARRMVNEYWRRTEGLWEDMTWELGMKLGLEDDETEKLLELDEVQ